MGENGISGRREMLPHLLALERWLRRRGIEIRIDLGELMISGPYPARTRPVGGGHLWTGVTGLPREAGTFDDRPPKKEDEP